PLPRQHPEHPSELADARPRDWRGRAAVRRQRFRLGDDRRERGLAGGRPLHAHGRADRDPHPPSRVPPGATQHAVRASRQRAGAPRMSDAAARAWTHVRAFGRMIRLSHTIFGLPFALAATALAHRFAREHGEEGLSPLRLLLIVLAFTGARAAAMGFNRLVARKCDAANPRTRDRELPRGAIPVPMAWLLTLASAGVFLASAVALGPVPAMLSPLCLVVV